MRLFVFLCCALPALAAAQSVYIEDLTWPEVRAAISGGKSTAIYYAGSTEQNGPHLALGKHNVIARHIAGRIAEELGNALVYPVLPFAPTGGHMKYPGTVNLSEKTFAAVAHDVAQSAIAAGFKHVLLMGDHGGGQDELKEVAQALDRAGKGARVFYIADVYTKSTGKHAGLEDTSELMYLDRARRWVRRDKIAEANAANGAEGDPQHATAELGSKLLDTRVKSAVAQIRQFVK